jgi:hypothetical protein
VAEASTSRWELQLLYVKRVFKMQYSRLESDTKTCILRVRQSKTVKIKEFATKSDFDDASKKKARVGARIG